jgi:hypothetical protein
MRWQGSLIAKKNVFQARVILKGEKGFWAFFGLLLRLLFCQFVAFARVDLQHLNLIKTVRANATVW